jgi:Ni/Co efflux regulator RcnB
MKTLSKFALAALAASVIAAPAAAAPNYRYDNAPRVSHVQTTKVVTRDNGRRQVTRVKQVRQVSRQQHRNWRKGERFDSRYASNYRVIQNPRAYRLHDAPRGYRWVQSNNDAVLVAVASGLIGAILANAF